MESEKQKLEGEREKKHRNHHRSHPKKEGAVTEGNEGAAHEEWPKDKVVNQGRAERREKDIF